MLRSVAASGAVGAVGLIATKVQLDTQIHKQGMGMAQTNYDIGYVLALVLLIVGAGWSAYRSLQRQDGVASALPPLGVPAIK
jgi:hypothetical protein